MSTKLRALLAVFAATLMFSGFGLTTGVANATGGTTPIEAKAISDHECDSSESHFVITQVDSESNAPASITVNWANGDSQSVPLDKFTGGVAHYTTTANLDSMVTSATTSIYEGWQGEFNYSHGPCGEQPPPPVQPEGSNNSSTPSCEKITVGTPTGIKPEGATVVVKLNGVVTQPGTYDIEPGTHVVTTYVNGTKVDEDTVTVDECPPPPADPSGNVVVVSNDCESITFSAKDVKPEDATVVLKLDGVAKPAGTYDVEPGQHTVELWVNGTKVDSETVTVKECEEEPPPPDSCPPLTGSVKTTLPDGSVVNGNIYTSKSDVYVYGDQLGDVTTVYIRVTDPSGSTVLSDVKQVSVVDGSFGPVQLPSFADTPNNGDEYKVWVSSTTDFEPSCTKFDNFKVRGEEPPPPVTPLNPSVTATATACVNKGESTGVVDFSVTNTDEGIMKPVTYTVTASNGATATVTAGNGETVKGTLTTPGFAPGEYTITVKGDDGTTATTKVTVKECTATSTPTPTPTPTPTVTPTPTPTETPTPTTPTETPTPTTPTETPTPEIGTPTSTSVPTPTANTPVPTSTPTFVPPSAGGGDWPPANFGSSQDNSLIGLMSKLMILLGGALLLVALFAPRRRKVMI